MGIGVLAALQFLGGLLLAFASLFLMLLSLDGPAIGFVLTLGLLLFSILLAYAAWGLWSGRGWAWTLNVVLGVIGIVGDAVGIALGDVSYLVSLAVGLIIIWYLFRPHVKRFFAGEYVAPISTEPLGD